MGRTLIGHFMEFGDQVPIWVQRTLPIKLCCHIDIQRH